jgi:hypothetical protein
MDVRRVVLRTGFFEHPDHDTEKEGKGGHEESFFVVRRQARV